MSEIAFLSSSVPSWLELAKMSFNLLYMMKSIKMILSYHSWASPKLSQWKDKHLQIPWLPFRNLSVLLRRILSKRLYEILHDAKLLTHSLSKKIDLDDKPERKPEKKPEKPREQPKEERIKSDRPPVTSTANTLNQNPNPRSEHVRNMPPSNPNMNANPNPNMGMRPQPQSQDNGPVFPPPKKEEKPNPPPQDKPKSSGWKLFS